MTLNELLPAKKRRFTDFASTDLLIRHCITGANGIEREIYEVGAIRRMAWHFDWLETTLRRIAKSKLPAVTRNETGYSLSTEAQDLWNVIKNTDEAPMELCAGRRLSPWLQVGLYLSRKWEPKLHLYTTVRGKLDMRQAYPRKAMVHIVKFIRRVCRSERFRAIQNNATRGATENYVRCCKYLLAVLRLHAKLLVMRIDLYFEGDAKVLCESEEAQKAYNKFLRHLSSSNIVTDVLAYAAKRENGLDRRIHFHVLVILDGNLHQRDHHLTEKLGAFWVNDCVGSPLFASFKNCSERKAEYKFNCIGVLHYTDEDMLKGLRLAVQYLCKEGAHILVGKGMGRNFRKGQAPKLPANGQRRGAPRKHGNDVSLAKRILLDDVP